MEAIVAFTVDGVSGDAATNFERLHTLFASQFARAEQIQSVDFEFTGGENLTPTANVSHHGLALHKFTSSDNTCVLQVSPTQFTFSQLPPYQNWEVFSGGVFALWSQYVELLEPASVRRVGLRYINRLTLPAGPINLSDYLRYYPATPAELGNIAGLVCQVQLPQSGLAADGMALVSLASEPATNGSASSMALDIDIFSNQPFDATVASMREILGDFRSRKNKIFEQILTDRMKENFR